MNKLEGAGRVYGGKTLSPGRLGADAHLPHHLPHHLCISELSRCCQDLLRAVLVHKPPPPDPSGAQEQDEKEV